MQQGCLPPPPSYLPSLNCSVTAVRFTLPMHISFIGGKMALSVFNCELVSIWLFVCPSVTFNISDTTHWILNKRDRMMQASQLHWLLNVMQGPASLFCPQVMSSIIETTCSALSKLWKLLLFTVTFPNLHEVEQGLGNRFFFFLHFISLLD